MKPMPSSQSLRQASKSSTRTTRHKGDRSPVVASSSEATDSGDSPPKSAKKGSNQPASEAMHKSQSLAVPVAIPGAKSMTREGSSSGRRPSTTASSIIHSLSSSPGGTSGGFMKHANPPLVGQGTKKETQKDALKLAKAIQDAVTNAGR